MRAATFDRADHSLTAVRRMSAEGFPILPPAPFTQASQEPDRVGAAEAHAPVSAAFLHFTESGLAQPDMTAPVRPPKPFAGAVTSLTQGSAAVEARAAHNRQVAGSTPAPATNSVAKTSEDNGRSSAAIGEPMAGEVSRGIDAADRQRPALPDFTGDDGGRSVQASGGAASVITLSEPAMILLRAIAAYEQVDDAAALTMALATHATKIGAGPLARAALDQIERQRHGDITDVPEFPRSGERRFVLTPKAPDGAFADANDARSGLRPKADFRSGGP